MNFGIPYKGSKSQIANWVLANLPKRKNLYDLFGGGGAITHRAFIKHNFVFYKHEISQKAIEDFAECPMPNVFFR